MSAVPNAVDIVGNINSFEPPVQLRIGPRLTVPVPIENWGGGHGPSPNGTADWDRPNYFEPRIPWFWIY